MKTITGLETLKTKIPDNLKNKNIGLLANPASIDSNFIHSKDIISNLFRGQLKALFSPQHGFNAEKQDNMILSEHYTDKALNIPVFSLYSKKLKPSADMFENIEVLLIDIQDVGTRVYTFIYTISYCLEAAKENNIKAVILDRPNPVSGEKIEGNILENQLTSFVGRYPIPMRHSLTVGEFALFINNEFNIGAELEVIPMSNWERSMYFQDTGLPWIMPSPNLPELSSVYVYPGQVIFEGTNISEGRGTTKPFEFFGAPFIETKKLYKYIKERYDIKGVFLREIIFQPTSGKWADIPCNGFQIHIIDKNEYKPYFLAISILQGIIQLFHDNFEYKKPPYEFEYKKMPIDLILGSSGLRNDIENNKDLKISEFKWLDKIEDYKKKILPYLLYK
ncbi:MAG: hypothetical protein CSA18_04650 [Deltaproteobacteria bacterium]|nr:MAG: hypothetical protein CSA18_04650 [Deltaproteobacteria bacterium]